MEKTFEKLGFRLFCGGETSELSHEHIIGILEMKLRADEYGSSAAKGSDFQRRDEMTGNSGVPGPLGWLCMKQKLLPENAAGRGRIGACRGLLTPICQSTAPSSELSGSTNSADDPARPEGLPLFSLFLFLMCVCDRNRVVATGAVLVRLH